MLSLNPSLNPAVARAAELFTDDQVTDAILRGVASMRGLPLLIEPGAAPTAADLRDDAEREWVGAASNARVARSLYATACRRLGMANQMPAAERRAAQGKAMASLNKARAELRRCERREAAATAALTALAH